MTLTDKEIALELTKAYLEHLNIRVNNKAPQSQATVSNVVDEFKIFYKTSSELGITKKVE